MPDNAVVLRLDTLTADQVQQIDRLIGQIVLASGHGTLTIVIERGVIRWVQPAPSLPAD